MKPRQQSSPLRRARGPTRKFTCKGSQDPRRRLQAQAVSPPAAPGPGGAQLPAREGSGGQRDLIAVRLIEVRYWRIHAEDVGALGEFDRTEGAAAEEGSDAAYQARHGDGEQFAEGGKVVESGRRMRGIEMS